MSPFYLPTNENNNFIHGALKHTWQYFYSEEF